MNVFATHPDPAVSASWLADQHVIKMVTETAQILSTVLHLRGSSVDGLYKPTHVHHPCVKAAHADPQYFGWTCQHGLSLAQEYQIRFGRVHRSERVLRLAIPSDGLCASYAPRYWPLAMPEDFKDPDPHKAYTTYLTEKYNMWRANGKKRSAPRWKRVVHDNPFSLTITEVVS